MCRRGGIGRRRGFKMYRVQRGKDLKERKKQKAFQKLKGRIS